MRGRAPRIERVGSDRRKGLQLRAIVISENGGPDVLQIRELPDPVPGEGDVLIRVRAFGVNHAETHMRKGEWAEAALVSGIECVGTIADDPAGGLAGGNGSGRDHGRDGPLA